MKAHNRFTENAGRGRSAPAIVFKVTPDEKASIKALARRHRVSVADWCRQRSLKDPAQEPASQASPPRRLAQK
jgi:hypothetical protein